MHVLPPQQRPVAEVALRKQVAPAFLPAVHDGYAQRAPRHSLPRPQPFPHWPQFASSVARSTHALLQQVPVPVAVRHVRPLGAPVHVASPQRPLVHASSDLHAVPHRPQFFVSLWVSTHPPPQHSLLSLVPRSQKLPS